MFSKTTIDRLLGADVIDPGGDKVGKVAKVYLDDTSGEPEWATVKLSKFRGGERFVPLTGATGDDELHVAYDKDRISSAPEVEADDHLTPDEESRLYAYYGDAAASGDSSGAGGDDKSQRDTAQTNATDDEQPTRDGGRHAAGRAGAEEPDLDSRQAAASGRSAGDRSADDGSEHDGTTADNAAMTRSEEQVRTGTERVQSGKARLRKYVETETVQVDVPVTKEKVRVEREPITDGDSAGTEIAEDEQEIVLSEERPVVTTETVPVEKVRLDVDVEESTETVSQDVRKERIEVEGAKDDAR